MPSPAGIPQWSQTGSSSPFTAGRCETWETSETPGPVFVPFVSLVSLVSLVFRGRWEVAPPGVVEVGAVIAFAGADRADPYLLGLDAILPQPHGEPAVIERPALQVAPRRFLQIVQCRQEERRRHVLAVGKDGLAVGQELDTKAWLSLLSLPKQAKQPLREPALATAHQRHQRSRQQFPHVGVAVFDAGRHLGRASVMAASAAAPHAARRARRASPSGA